MINFMAKWPAAMVGLLLAAGSLVWQAAPARADTGLHIYFPGFADNGANTPFPSDMLIPSDFGFTIGSGPTTGKFKLVILVPNTYANDTDGIGVTGTYTKPDGSTGTVNTTATHVNGPEWTSGDLGDYLGLASSPQNPGAYICGKSKVCAEDYAPGVTGFDVYTANLGMMQLNSPSQPNVMPLLSLTQELPAGSYILGFFKVGSNWVSTVNSGAGLVTVPEPASVALLGTALAGMYFGTVARSRRRRRPAQPL